MKTSWTDIQVKLLVVWGWTANKVVASYDFVVAHPRVSAGVACVVVGIAIGKFL